MAKLSAARGDDVKAAEGVWVEHELGFRFLVRRMPNEQYVKLRRKLMKPMVRKLRTTIDLEATDLVTKEAVARTVLANWEKIEDDEGKPIPFSAEKALEVFQNPAYEDIYNFIVAEAQDLANFEADDKKKAVGNSGASS